MRELAAHPAARRRARQEEKGLRRGNALPYPALFSQRQERLMGSEVRFASALARASATIPSMSASAWMWQLSALRQTIRPFVAQQAQPCTADAQAPTPPCERACCT